MGEAATATLNKGIRAGKEKTGVFQEQLGLESNPFKVAQAEDDARLDEAIKQLQKQKTTSTTDQDTTTTTGTDQTSQTTFDPRGDLEQRLLDESVGAFEQQQALVGQQQADIEGRGGLQEQARTGLGGILGGGAFDLTQGEQGRIDAFRQASLAGGSNRIQNILDERLAAVEADAARRGIRGQAFTQLQGSALGAANQAETTQQLAANQVAAQQALQLPGQRAGLQAQVGQGFAGFQDALTQQAIQNQALLQNPVALAQLREERLKGGATTQAGQTTQQQTGGTTTTQVGALAPQAILQQASGPGQAGAATGGALETLGAVGKIAGPLVGLI